MFEGQFHFCQHQTYQVNTYISSHPPRNPRHSLTGSEVISGLFQASLEAIIPATSDRLIFITRSFYWDCGAAPPGSPSMGRITLDEPEQDLSPNYLSSHKVGSPQPVTP